MDNIEFEIDGTLAVVRLPDQVTTVRVFIGPNTARKRVDLIDHNGKIATSVVDVPQKEPLRPARRRPPALVVG